MLILAILLLLCFIVINWYPIDGIEWNIIKSRISEKYRQNEMEFLKKMGYKYTE